MQSEPGASPEKQDARASSQPVFWNERYQAHDRLKLALNRTRIWMIYLQ